MAKTIFITGATGYLGHRLALHLANSGHTVHALVRDLVKANTLLAHPCIKLYQGSILNSNSISIAMKGCDEVYHLAALASVWSKDPKTFDRINVEGLSRVLDCCVDADIKSALFTSTAGVVGHSTNMEPVAEFTNPSPVLETLYEKSKLKAELVLKKYVDQGFRAIIVNPSRVYGPGLLTESNGFTRLMQMYLSGKWNVKPGNGNSIGNYVYIDDVISGFILAMEKARPGERYLLGGVDVSYNEFFDTLGKLSGQNKKLYNLPITIMLLFSYVQLGLANTIGKHPIITPPFVKKYSKNWLVSSQKAKNELGYTITPLETGLKKTLEWLESQSQFPTVL